MQTHHNDGAAEPAIQLPDFEECPVTAVSIGGEPPFLPVLLVASKVEFNDGDVIEWGFEA